MCSTTDHPPNESEVLRLVPAIFHIRVSRDYPLQQVVGENLGDLPPQALRQARGSDVRGMRTGAALPANKHTFYRLGTLARLWDSSCPYSPDMLHCTTGRVCRGIF